MKNFYFYQTKYSTKAPDFMVCFYSGSAFCFEVFCNEVVIQFKSSIFIRNIVFVTLAFNKEDIKSKLFSNKAQLTIKDRINSFQELNFHTCFVKRNGEFELNIFNKEKSKLTNSEMEKLIDFGLFKIITNRNLIIEAYSNIHFIKPSGKHTNKFIDVKNLLESAPEIAFIATCLLKLIPENISKIYVDTSGIYSLAYELSNITRAFDKSVGIISIDSFGSYGGIDQYNFSADVNTIVLISASTSNNLVEKLRNYASLDQSSFVVVIMTQVNNGEQKVLIEFEQYKNKFSKSYFQHFDSYDESECPMCLKEHSIPITLDKSRFFVDTPRTESYLPLALDSDSNLRELINRYKDIDAFRCLFDSVDGTKKPTPEYFIDISKIIKQKQFQEQVKNNIYRYFPLNTDCIIHCKDQGAKELAELIQKNILSLDLKVTLYDGEIPDNIRPKKGIVVVAGSLESGKSLLNISRALREFNKSPITYIVGFAKYNGESEFKKLQMDLSFSEGPCGFHQFHVIEKILIPINEHKENSWDKEIEVLKIFAAKYQNDLKLKKVIDVRSQRLRKASSIEKKGLGKKLFIPSPTGKHLILGKTFAFWNKEDNDSKYDHQATVYFTVSSVLQKLRTTAKNNGIKPLGHGYIIRQLDPLLFDRFNEGIIQASVLRTAKSRELDYSADDAKSRIIGSLIERMLKYPETEESTGLPEFLLALCTKKLQIKKDHLRGLNNHSLDKKRNAMTWMLAVYAKELLLENTQNKEVSTTKLVKF